MTIIAPLNGPCQSDGCKSNNMAINCTVLKVLYVLLIKHCWEFMTVGHFNISIPIPIPIEFWKRNTSQIVLNETFNYSAYFIYFCGFMSCTTGIETVQKQWLQQTWSTLLELPHSCAVLAKQREFHKYCCCTWRKIYDCIWIVKI